MHWYHWLSLVSLLICIVFLSLHVVRLLRLGRPKDFSKRRGNVARAVRYSFTGAMSPRRKESAYLHLPTYAAGIVYHLGTFLSAAVFILLLLQAPLSGPVIWAMGALLLLSGLSGLGILVKRGIRKELQHLSAPEDYISNLLVTVQHLLTAAVLWFPEAAAVYFVWTGLLLLYIPAGKLRHSVYFFAARYHLGFFYGWRNVWPHKNADSHGTS